MMPLREADSRRPRALVVVAKAAVAGEVKTRLCPPLTSAQAAALYECLFKDIVDKMESYGAADLWIAFAPEGRDYFTRTVGLTRRLLAQRGSGLSRRVHHIFTDLFHSGYSEVIVADSDSPLVPLSSVARAYKHLGEDGYDVVLGPSSDGGYYLVGLKSPTEGLFRDIPWSSGAVLEKTLERASELGLKTALLPVAYDIDTEDDLQRLWQDFKTVPECRERAPKTYGFLTQLFYGSK